MRRPRLVATDLDGTLLRTDHTCDERTRRALRRAEDAGALVVFVTARPPRWLTHIADLLADPVPDAAGVTRPRATVICSNGALVYDPHAGRVLASRLLDVPTLHAVARRLGAALPGLVFAAEFGFSFGREPGYVHEWDVGPVECRVGPWPRVLDRPAAKLLARGPALDPDTLLARAAAAVRGLAEVTCSSSSGVLEISAPGVDKATALAALAARVGIAAADVLAFGDMPNDLPMLGWAGRSVAVANAHRDVLAAADEITAGNDESGVALVLERVFGAAPAAVAG